MTRPSDEEFAAWVDATCFSTWEGHACHRPKRHDGRHQCGSKTCDDVTWTDEDERAWMVLLRDDFDQAEADYRNDVARDD